MATVGIGIGSNLGDRAANLASAVAGLGKIRASRLVDRAGEYETAPVGGPAGQGKFLNSAALVETELEPLGFLAELHGLERRIGRAREKERVRWGPRIIDLDILLWDDVVFDAPTLIIPHPRLAEREFALRPLADVAGDRVHPLLGLTVRQLLERVIQGS